MTAAEGASADLRLEIDGRIATLTFDRPGSKVNLLTRDVMRQADERLREIEEAADAGAVAVLVIRSAKPENFIAGADIDELAELEEADEARELSHEGQKILNRIADLPIATLAAIHGSCVGGGLELVLTCDYRVASLHPGTRLGLPETRLGILPGLGGTVRLPRLIGLRAALDLILSGKLIDAKRARSRGLVDRVWAAEELDAQVDVVARKLAAGEAPLPRSRRSFWTRWIEDGALGRRILAYMARKQTLRETKGHYPAPLRALDVTVAGLGMSRDRALETEARAFAELAVTPECKNLIHVFRLNEGAKKRRPRGSARPVQEAGVVGAGVMGAGIAELFAYQKIPVQVVDIDRDRVEAGLGRARELLEKLARRRHWSPEQLEARTSCLNGTTSYEGFGSVDLAVEAVVERLDVKRQVFDRLEQQMPATAVIATNTSALPVTDLQRGLRHAGRVCGLHFFNPPHRMPLVEVVRGADTAEDTLATAFDVATRLGKTPVVVADRPGFVVNRILAAYLTEAGHLLQEGLAIQTTDQVMTRFGMPMGPFRLLDEVGLDIVAEVSETLISGLGRRFEPAPVVREIVATGLTGVKGGRGFYRYEDGRPKGVDDQVARIVASRAGQDPPDPGVARERMVYAMINEAARTLGDEVVAQPADVDIAMILGTGFPPFRGGLLRYADSIGLDRIATGLREFAQRVGPRFEPAPELLNRRSFYDA